MARWRLIEIRVERFKQKIQWIVVRRDLLSVLDACKVADFVVLVLSANQEVDKHGELILRSIEAQGISNTIPVAQVFSFREWFLDSRPDGDHGST